MKLIIGCPIYKRSWIFPLWASAIERQSVPLNKIGFVFETSPDDLETTAMLRRWRAVHPEIPFFEIKEREDVPHFEHAENSRQWTMSKYENMVSLRNSLLTTVREIEPDYYFSLDSDIIIKNPATIELLIAHIQDGADAVNPLMFMTPLGTDFPSVMSWIDKDEYKAKREKKYPLGTYFKSDVIMAAKMMSKKTYQNIDYKIHSQGEDLGWSENASRNGLNLYCASYIYAPHIMHPFSLESFRREGDPRELVTI